MIYYDIACLTLKFEQLIKHYAFHAKNKMAQTS